MEINGVIIHCACCGVPLTIKEEGYAVVKIDAEEKGEEIEILYVSTSSDVRA